MLHQNKEAGWKYLLQLTEKHRRHSFQVLNHFSRQLLGTKLVEEIAQLCQHDLDMLRDEALNHRWKKALNPYVEVVTLHP